MKKFLSLITFLSLTAGVAFARGYDMNFPLAGKSIANDNLQQEVTTKIYKIATKKYPACLNYNITNTQIVHYPYDVKKKKGKYTSGYWKEIWTVKACDNTFQVPLTFYINKKGARYSIDM